MITVSEGVEIGSFSASRPLEIEGLVEGINQSEIMILFELIKRKAEFLVLFLRRFLEFIARPIEKRRLRVGLFLIESIEYMNRHSEVISSQQFEIREDELSILSVVDADTV